MRWQAMERRLVVATLVCGIGVGMVLPAGSASQAGVAPRSDNESSQVVGLAEPAVNADEVAIAQAFVDRRDSAILDNDRRRLEGLTVPGSPARLADEDILAVYGGRVRRLSTRVESVDVVDEKTWRVTTTQLELENDAGILLGEQAPRCTEWLFESPAVLREFRECP